MQGNPLPALTWGCESQTKKQESDQDQGELQHERVEGCSQKAECGGEKEVVKLAVDHLVVREKELVERDNRTPAGFSRVMNDAVCWFWRAAPSHPFSRIS